jgi:Holliday junction DNA helicase RuvA
MRDRLKALAPPQTADGARAPPNEASSPHSEAYSALIALGYKPPEVLRLLKGVDPSVKSTEEMIRHALRSAASA